MQIQSKCVKKKKKNVTYAVSKIWSLVTKIKRMSLFVRSGRYAPTYTWNGSSQGGGIAGLFYFLPCTDLDFIICQQWLCIVFIRKKLLLIFKRRIIGKYIDIMMIMSGGEKTT